MIGKNGNKKNQALFLAEIIKFFKSSICGTASSVEILYNVEKKYKKEYEKFKASRINPSSLYEWVSNMEESEKEIFILISSRANMISTKMNNLFDLKLEDKKELADELNSFGEFAEEKLKELVKKRGIDINSECKK